MIDTSPEALARLRESLAETGGIFAVPKLFDTILALIDTIDEMRKQRDHPGMAIVCQVCALKQPPAEAAPAGSWPEIAEEARQSLPVKRQ